MSDLSKVRIGVDFDNTIICYDGIFHKVALEKKLILSEVPAGKGQIRDYLREIGKEDEWTKMQGYVYGTRLKDATPFPGVTEFFLYCKQQDISVYIVSHKTHHPYMGPKYDLHRAAYEWLEFQGFFDPGKIGLSDEDVFFELTKAEKLKRIADLECTHFIDDLPEFLCETDFPGFTDRILFDPNEQHPDGSDYPRMTSWKEIKGIFRDVQAKG